VRSNIFATFKSGTRSRRLPCAHRRRQASPWLHGIDCLQQASTSMRDIALHDAASAGLR
jgi:hypothetical protein